MPVLCFYHKILTNLKQSWSAGNFKKEKEHLAVGEILSKY